MNNYIKLLIACFAIFLLNSQEKQFKLGLENIPEQLIQKLKKRKYRIGIITNQTGIDQNYDRNIDVLLGKGLNIKKIYTPEHGINGMQDAGHEVGDSVDKKTGIKIVSLYTGDSQFRKFNKDDLTGIDIFIFDIQDSGMRHYTYISILYKIMEVAAEFNKRIIVLDRPNPLGVVMEGPLVSPHLRSFVSIANIPLRHAMSVGELAKFFNKFELKKKAKLLVIPMKNYTRDLGLNGNLPVYLSPNIRNIDACLNYSFLGMLGDISPFNVMTGTKDAFKCFLINKDFKLPIAQWKQLQALLIKNNLEATPYKVVKPEGKTFIGFKIKIKDINNFSGLNSLVTILRFFKKNGFTFSYAKIFNKLIGNEQFESYINSAIFNKSFRFKVNKDLQTFFDKIKNLLIYKPLPKIIFLSV